MRKLVELDHQLGRLEAERDGRTWDDPEYRQPANMHGIRALQKRMQEENAAALTEVLLDLAQQRSDERDRFEIAEAMSIKLTRPFHPGSLYRPPYDTMWREVDVERIVGNHLADSAYGAAGRARLSKRLLVHHIKRRTGLRDGLLEERRAKLLAQSVAEDWEPLPKNRSARAGAATPAGGPKDRSATIVRLPTLTGAKVARSSDAAANDNMLRPVA